MRYSKTVATRACNINQDRKNCGWGFGVKDKGAERRRYWRDKDGHSVGIERRRYRRVPCEIHIFYSPVDRQLSGISRTIDISSGGIMLHAQQVIAEGKFLNLALALPKPPKIKTMGVVRWTSRTKDMPHYLGIEFSQIRNEDQKRIADHIYT